MLVRTVIVLLTGLLRTVRFDAVLLVRTVMELLTMLLRTALVAAVVHKLIKG